MKDDMTNAVPEFRERVVVFLAFLTSEDCQAACRRHARPEERPVGLPTVYEHVDATGKRS